MLLALTTAADVAGLSGAAQTILVAGIGVTLGFVAYKVIRSAMLRF